MKHADRQRPVTDFLRFRVDTKSEAGSFLLSVPGERRLETVRLLLETGLQWKDRVQSLSGHVVALTAQSEALASRVRELETKIMDKLDVLESVMRNQRIALKSDEVQGSNSGSGAGIPAAMAPARPQMKQGAGLSAFLSAAGAARRQYTSKSKSK